MSDVTTVGIDLAKYVFSVHGVDAEGTVVLRRSATRAKLLELIVQLPPWRNHMSRRVCRARDDPWHHGRVGHT